MKPPSPETGHGPEPWALRSIARGWVGILRGRSAVVLLDEELHERARLPAPRSPSGIAVAKNGDVLVVGELSSAVARYAVENQTLVALGASEVPGVRGLRDIAVSPAGAVWVVDERGGRVLRVTASGAVAASVDVGHGAAGVVATAKHVVVNAVTEHTLVVITTDSRGVETRAPAIRLTNDGPFWGFDARETDAGLVILAGGVEDHPLDRRDGYFGWIDSFVFGYRVHQAEAKRFAAINVSERGVITPKGLAITNASTGRLDALVTGYGSPTGLELSLLPDGEEAREPKAITMVPGVRTIERGAHDVVVMADPLLDAWIRLAGGAVTVVPVDLEPPRPLASKLGEALFFTSLMAPRNTASGAHSRFTCETCHFEGYGDGRTHHTGRQDVHATTKPLLGLIGNRPHFSRALDPDLSTVAHAEFRVAGAGNPADPFFAVEPTEHPWLAHLGVREAVSPLDLRRALMRFLSDFSHRPNPATVGRTSFSALEREGASAFRRHCEGCHSARLSADDPSSHVAFERWEALIFTEAAPLVWASAGYHKTGVLPYVHDEGARTPSLRRLHKKYPFLTNGSVRSIERLLRDVRLSNGQTMHANGPDDAERLDAASQRALAAFLELL